MKRGLVEITGRAEPGDVLFGQCRGRANYPDVEAFLDRLKEENPSRLTLTDVIIQGRTLIESICSGQLQETEAHY